MEHDNGRLSRNAKANIALATRNLLVAINEDTNRDGLADTPKRVANFWNEWLKPAKEDFSFTVFDSEGMDELVVVRNIQFYSMCEHHLLPFFGKVTVGYIPNGEIVGISKIPRCVRWIAQRPQNQERLTALIACAIDEAIKPKGVGVVCTARHLCMEMRGARAEGAETKTNFLLGIMKEKEAVRAEFLHSVGG